MNQISKLNKLTQIAKTAIESENLAKQIGGLTIRAGLLEFSCIQVFRVLEQIWVKEALETKQEFKKPKEDQFFYEEKIDTRKILKNIKKMIPLRKLKGDLDEDELEEINQYLKDFVSSCHKFLNKRNLIIHHIGNPSISIDEIKITLKEVNDFFDDAIKAQEVMPKLSKFTLTADQCKQVYG
ncbi:hypothetical protein KKH36_00420 [Patescibacteria group bacterium]|nr:hypothetical protein [Patescibacteria group bacterium]